MKHYHSIIVKTAHFDNSTSKLGLAYERITERTNRCKITGMNVNDLVQHALMQLFRLAFATKLMCKMEIESPPRFCTCIRKNDIFTDHTATIVSLLLHLH